MPDTENFGTIFCSSALDAANSVSLMLEFILKNDVNHCVTVASLSIDTVDMYIQEMDHLEFNGPESEMKVLAHPLMQREL